MNLQEQKDALHRLDNMDKDMFCSLPIFDEVRDNLKANSILNYLCGIKEGYRGDYKSSIMRSLENCEPDKYIGEIDCYFWFENLDKKLARIGLVENILNGGERLEITRLGRLYVESLKLNEKQAIPRRYDNARRH